MLTIVPQEELERIAREEYAERYANVPEPVVINVEPLIMLDAPRDFSWGGIGYRAPPPDFPTGAQLLVAANVLRDLRMADAPADARREVVLAAVPVIRAAVRPVGRLSRFLDWLLPCPFRRSDPADIEGLCRWILAAPDESTVVPTTERIAADLVDGLAAFVREFPAWVTPDGWPVTYRHYLYGMRHLARHTARQQYRTAIAARMAQVDPEAWTPYAEELRSAAGWEPLGDDCVPHALSLSNRLAPRRPMLASNGGPSHG